MFCTGRAILSMKNSLSRYCLGSAATQPNRKRVRAHETGDAVRSPEGANPPRQLTPYDPFELESDWHQPIRSRGSDPGVVCAASAGTSWSYRIFLTLIACLLIIPVLGNPVAFGQIAVSKILNPNESAVSRSADIYDPQTGRFSPVAGKSPT